MEICVQNNFRIPSGRQDHRKRKNNGKTDVLTDTSLRNGTTVGGDDEIIVSWYFHFANVERTWNCRLFPAFHLSCLSFQNVICLNQNPLSCLPNAMTYLHPASSKYFNEFLRLKMANALNNHVSWKSDFELKKERTNFSAKTSHLMEFYSCLCFQGCQKRMQAVCFKTAKLFPE